MIVKILFDKGFVLYDNFERVHYQHVENKKIKEHACNCDASWFEENSQTTHFILICGRKRTKRDENLSEKLYGIMANCAVYLLNDEGKTIERIN